MHGLPPAVAEEELNPLSRLTTTFLVIYIQENLLIYRILFSLIAQSNSMINS